jgi:hypothetical protein
MRLSIIMSSKRPPAESPTTALFDLAERMADNYNKIKYLKYYAYAFIGVSLLILLAVAIAFFASGNPTGILILAVIICGLMLLRLVLFTIHFLDDFDTNFQAIRMIRMADPLPKIPSGKNARARLEAYLRTTDPAVVKELKNKANLTKNFTIANTKWQLAIVRQSVFMGPDEHLTLVHISKTVPKMPDLIKLEKDLETVARSYIPPKRAIILCKAPGAYNGLSDDLYSYLTEKEHYIHNGKMKHRVMLQVFVEYKGRYEIIPLLP